MSYLSELDEISESGELYDSDRLGGDPNDPFNEKAIWYSVDGDGSKSGTSGHIDAAVGLDKGIYSWDYFEVEVGSGKLSAGLSTNVVEGLGFSSAAEFVYGKALIKIPVFGHKLIVGVKGNLGSVGASGRIGLKTEIAFSYGIGGGLVVEWE